MLNFRDRSLRIISTVLVRLNSYGHRDTVDDPEALVDKSLMICAIAKAFNLVKAI